MNDLPKGWELKKLGELCKVKGGKRLPKGSSFSNVITNRPYLRVTDMINKSIRASDLKYVPEEVFNKIKNYTISKEDVYITIAGTIGVSGTIPDELDGASLTENAAKLVILNKTHLDKKYLVYVLHSLKVQQQIKSLTGTVGVPKLALFRIEDLQIPFPAFSVQKQVVSILERTEKIKEKRKQTDDDTDKIIQSIFYEMFGDPIKNEKGYEIKNVGSICFVTKLAGFEFTKYIKYQDKKLKETDVIVLRGLNFKENKLKLNEKNVKYIPKSVSDSLTRSKVEKNDLLMTFVGTLGEVAISPESEKYHLGPNTARIKIMDNSILPYFLLYQFKTSFIQNQIKRLTKTSTQGSISMYSIRLIRLIIPPIDLQNEFVLRVKKIESLKDKQKQSTNDLNQLFDVLMQKAFNGELV